MRWLFVPVTGQSNDDVMHVNLRKFEAALMDAYNSVLLALLYYRLLTFLSYCYFPTQLAV
jgi:hypothetical protein